jgi:hypothetical protein
LMPLPRHNKISVARSNDDVTLSEPEVVETGGNVLYFRWSGFFSRFGIETL